MLNKVVLILNHRIKLKLRSCVGWKRSLCALYQPFLTKSYLIKSLRSLLLLKHLFECVCHAYKVEINDM